MSVNDPGYTERLRRRSDVWWKRLLHTQAPYRWNLRRLEPGYVLDVGCGVGRNLEHVDGHGVGVDTNPTSVARARAAGLTAYTPDEFGASPHALPRSFDTMLLAHVLEHMHRREAVELIAAYLPFVQIGGRVLVIVPQEAGFASDATHVEFLDADDVAGILSDLDITVTGSSSFPFPRQVGRWFRYNETVVVGAVGPSGSR